MIHGEIRWTVRTFRFLLGLSALLLWGLIPKTAAGDSGTENLADTVARIKPSIVGVGTVLKTRRPPNVLMATGFIILEGRHVITNAHAIPEKMDRKKNEMLVVFSGHGRNSRTHPARILEVDEEHDLALLEIDGPPLPAMTLGDDKSVREGELFAFTGFPLGAVLGLYPATSRGIISAITPVAIPGHHSRRIKTGLYRRLKNPYLVFQLDAVAYPGNSGSPVYDVSNGEVIGVINMVFVKGTKEHAITNPSGITYAIPVQYVHKIIEKAKLKRP